MLAHFASCTGTIPGHRGAARLGRRVGELGRRLPALRPAPHLRLADDPRPHRPRRCRGAARHPLAPELRDPLLGECSEFVRRSARPMARDRLPTAFVTAPRAKPGTRLELVTPSLPFAVAGGRCLRRKAEVSRCFAGLPTQIPAAEPLLDMSQYAGIDLAFCHSRNTSGRTKPGSGRGTLQATVRRARPSEASHLMTTRHSPGPTCALWHLR